MKNQVSGRKQERNVNTGYTVLCQFSIAAANNRSAYHWEVAKRLINGADALVFEDLNILGMKSRCKPKPNESGGYDRNGQSAKKGLNRVISDAAWGELVKKVEVVAAKSGILVVKVNPRHTSQQCPRCHHISADNRKGEKFVCAECGYHDDADVNGAVNIRTRGLKKLGIDSTQLPSVRGEVTPMETTVA